MGAREPGECTMARGAKATDAASADVVREESGPAVMRYVNRPLLLGLVLAGLALLLYLWLGATAPR